MNGTREFSFGSGSVATAYDQVLVPILFDPWARRLADEHQPWEGRRVLDVATGTGIVAQLLARRVGPRGKVVGADVNAEMLEVARRQYGELTRTLEFVECPADGLDIPDDAVDVVVCQQGFQFFPDLLAAAREIYRVLRIGGRLIATTWRPVSECEFFGSICTALESVNERELAEMMRVPFDLMSETNLTAALSAVGFENVRLERQEQDFHIEGGIGHAVSVAYATPIGPRLRHLDEDVQERFRKALADELEMLSPDGISMGRMVSSVFTAEKPN